VDRVGLRRTGLCLKSESGKGEGNKCQN